jgi:hypothetical protein
MVQNMEISEEKTTECKKEELVMEDEEDSTRKPRGIAGAEAILKIMRNPSRNYINKSKQ